MVSRTEQLVLDLDPELASELGIDGAEKLTPKAKPAALTYAGAMASWDGKLSKVLAHPDPVEVLRLHPWTAANIPDPAEWLALQRAKAPGVMTDTEYRDQLAAALSWMNDKGTAVAGRKNASRFLGGWISRTMERRRANIARGAPAPSSASLNFDDPGTRARVTGGGRG